MCERVQVATLCTQPTRWLPEHPHEGSGRFTNVQCFQVGASEEPQMQACTKLLCLGRDTGVCCVCVLCLYVYVCSVCVCVCCVCMCAYVCCVCMLCMCVYGHVCMFCVYICCVYVVYVCDCVCMLCMYVLCVYVLCVYMWCVYVLYGCVYMCEHACMRVKSKVPFLASLSSPENDR